jgi:predicted extracellular nuclease
MKRLFTGKPLCGLLLLGLGATPAWASSELYFSEYIEGSSNNKALEIFNGTDAAIDLAAYEVQFFFNGSLSAGFTYNLNGTLSAGEVYVLAHSSANADILAQADATSGAGFYNGDDAVVLLRGGVVIDAIGQIGTDPGSAWGTAPVTTANATLRRLASVNEGDADAYDAFDPSLQWEGFPTDTTDDLGSYGDSGDGDDGDSDGDGSGACGEAVTLISAIQGAGATSPLVGQTVDVEAVVTGLRDGGFFVQEEDIDADADALTAEGLFVESAAEPLPGSQVRVHGTVVERFGRTGLQVAEIAQVVECAAGIALPLATRVDFPLADGFALEQVEGMRVTVDNLLVTDINNIWRYGEIGLSHELKRQPSDVFAPLSPEYLALEAANTSNLIYVEDDSSARFPATLSIYPQFSYANPIRVGDRVSATGPLNFDFGLFRINPEQTLLVQGERPLAPELATGNLTVASFNVLNYFNGEVTADGSVTFDYELNRGATSVEAFALQEARIVEAIRILDADVLGLMELENDGFGADSAIHSLVDAVNAQLPPSQAYAFIRSATDAPVGTDAITVGLIYRPAVVDPIGAANEIAMPVQDLGSGQSAQMRTALLQTFRHRESGVDFATVVNHFKSKGSACLEDLNSPAQTDVIQGNCNALRVSAAVTLGDALAATSLPERVLILGDLNSYSAEDPMAVLTGYDPAERGYTIRSARNTAADGGASVDVTTTYGYTNIGALFEPEGFSYWFYANGLVGSLDHVLASPAARDDVVDATHWQINSVEAYQLQYDQALQFYPDSAGYDFAAIGPYRSSDHDPLIVSLYLESEALAGDFNGDGRRNWRDLNLLVRHLFRRVNDRNEIYDLNNDGWINLRDVTAFGRLG